MNSGITIIILFSEEIKINQNKNFVDFTKVSEEVKS